MISDPIRVGRLWVFPDGRTLPVVTGASDDSVDAAVVDVPAPDPTPVDTFEPSDGESFDTPAGTKVFTADYVQRLREENKSYRTKAQSLEERLKPFDGLDDGDFEWFTNAASRYREGGLDALVEYAKPLYADLIEAGATPEQAEAIVEAAEEAAETEKPLTAKDLDRVLSEREQAKAQEAAEQAKIAEAAKYIDSKLAEAGVEKGSEEYEDILTFAHVKRLKIEDAITKWRDRERAIIDRYVASKTAGPKTVTGSPGEQDPFDPSKMSWSEVASHAQSMLRARDAARQGM